MKLNNAKNFFCSAIVCFTASCGARQYHDAITLNSSSNSINSIAEADVKSLVEILASEEFQGRGSGYAGDEKASLFIAEKFRSFGLLPLFEESYTQEFKVNRGRGYSWNVGGYLPGNDPSAWEQIILVGAHYDHLGQSGSSIYFGADDNASGTAAVIEIARALGQEKDKLGRTVVFIAFSGEELGLIGSTHYVNTSPILDRIRYMINLDMVGYLRNKKLSFYGAGASNTLSTLIKNIAEKYPNIQPELTSSAGGGSDHAPFIKKGVPATFAHTGMTSVYHRPTDTAEKINYEGLTDVTKMVFEICRDLTQSNQLERERSLPELTRETELDHGIVPFIQ